MKILLTFCCVLITFFSLACGVTAGFSPSATIVCSGEIVNFTNTSTGAISYEWHLEEFTFSSSTDAVLSFSAPGDYNIELIADDELGCLDSITIIITVEQPPNAGSDYSGIYCNINDSIALNTLLDGDLGGSWIENSSSTQFNTSTSVFDFTGLQEDTYSFDYVVFANSACDNDTAAFEIDVNQQPSLSLNLTENSIGLSDSIYVDFDTSGTNLTTSMIWQFCDDNLRGDEAPFYYQWQAAGDFCICVTINNNNGCATDVCDSSIVIVDDLSLGVEQKNDFNIYPNPANNELFITLIEPVNIKSIELIAFDGKSYELKMNSSLMKQTLDLSEFPNGLYILRSTGNRTTSFRRLIIQH